VIWFLLGVAAAAAVLAFDFRRDGLHGAALYAGFVAGVSLGWVIGDRLRPLNRGD
jgi:hypothetical protein